AVFVLAISSYYLLQERHMAFAKRSFAIAAGFGLASVLSVIVLGDASGYTIGEVQRTKLALIEAEWETQPAPAAFTLFGFPDQDTQTTKYAVRIPYALGIIATRSVDTPIEGIKEIQAEMVGKMQQGIKAYALLEKIREGNATQTIKDQFNDLKYYLGYGLLLKRYVADPKTATHEQIVYAAEHALPRVAPLFWSFRIMVGCGFIMLYIFCAAMYYNTKRVVQDKRWFLKLCLWSLPLPWIAAECGWIVAEYGRQPWVIAEVLPTFLGVSSVSTKTVLTSLIGLVVLYSALLVVELYLMFKYARLGPEGQS
ncbi:MAG TPA: cytochrome ubiquinol oxidase subunit I, partial [Gammaproteobacteria bacterium]|nr:cytochrome ubiquinol oxidase subunit I [Gammaproteobacteria bacterium]